MNRMTAPQQRQLLIESELNLKANILLTEVNDLDRS